MSLYELPSETKVFIIIMFDTVKS